MNITLSKKKNESIIKLPKKTFLTFYQIFSELKEIFWAFPKNKGKKYLPMLLIYQ